MVTVSRSQLRRSQAAARRAVVKNARARVAQSTRGPAVPGAGVWIDHPGLKSYRRGANRAFVPMADVVRSSNFDTAPLRARKAVEGTYEGVQEDIRHLADRLSVLKARREDIHRHMRSIRPRPNRTEELRLQTLLHQLETDDSKSLRDPKHSADVKRVRDKWLSLAQAWMSMEYAEEALAKADARIKPLQDELQNARRKAAAIKIQRAYRTSAGDPGTVLGRRTILRRGDFDPNAHPGIVAPRGGRLRLPGMAR